MREGRAVYKEPDLIAHSGYAAKYPENTLIAFESAIRAGTQFIECDVQLSGDQVPVLFHDATMERICGQQGAIHDYPLSALQQFHAALPDRFANKFADVAIATLQDLVHLLKQHPKVTVFFQVGPGPGDAPGKAFSCKSSAGNGKIHLGLPE